MTNKDFNKDLGSYISFALRKKEPITLPGHFDKKGNFNNKSVKINFDNENKLSDREFSTIEKLMEKHLLFKKYIPKSSSLDNLKIIKPKKTEFRAYKENPKSDYRIVTVNSKQLEIAKNIAKRVDYIHKSYLAERHVDAKKSYLKLQSYLDKKRESLFGDFETIQEVEDSFGLHAVGTNGNPQVMSGGAVVFVIIEIYVSS
jgi:hypothetical protein